MTGAGVPTVDLHAVIEAAGAADCISDDGVHMTDAGYSVLAEAVSAGIADRLAVDQGYSS